MFRFQLTRIIADRVAFWLIKSLHPRELEVSETLVVIGSQPLRGAAPEKVSPRSQKTWFRERKVLVARSSKRAGSEQTC